MELNEQGTSFRLDSGTHPPRSADGVGRHTYDEIFDVKNRDLVHEATGIDGGGDDEGHLRTSGVPSSQHLREAKISGNPSANKRSVHALNSKKYSEEKVFAPVRLLQVGVRTSSQNVAEAVPPGLTHNASSLGTKELPGTASPTKTHGAGSTHSLHGRNVPKDKQSFSIDPNEQKRYQPIRSGPGPDSGFYSPHKTQTGPNLSRQTIKQDSQIKQLLDKTAIERNTWRARRGWQGSPTNQRSPKFGHTQQHGGWARTSTQNSKQPKHMIIISSMTPSLPPGQVQTVNPTEATINGPEGAAPTQLYDFSIIEQPKGAPASGPNSTLHQIKMLNKHNLDARELRYKQAKFKGRMRSQQRQLPMPHIGTAGITLTASEERFNVFDQQMVHSTGKPEEDSKASNQKGYMRDMAGIHPNASVANWRPSPFTRTGGAPASIHSGAHPYSATGYTRGSSHAAAPTIGSSRIAGHQVGYEDGEVVSCRYGWPGGGVTQEHSPEKQTLPQGDRAISIRSYLAAQRHVANTLQSLGDAATGPISIDQNSRAVTRIVAAESPELMDHVLAPTLAHVVGKSPSPLRTDPSFAAGFDVVASVKGPGDAPQSSRNQRQAIHTKVTEERSARTEEGQSQTTMAKNASLARGTDYFGSATQGLIMADSFDRGVKSQSKRDMPSVQANDNLKVEFESYANNNEALVLQQQQRTGLSTAVGLQRPHKRIPVPQDSVTMPSGSMLTSGAPQDPENSFMNKTMQDKRTVVTPVTVDTRAKAGTNQSQMMLNQVKSQSMYGRGIPRKQLSSHHAWNWSQKIEQMSSAQKQEEMRTLIRQQFEYQPTVLTAMSGATGLPGSSNIIVDEDRQRRLFDQLGIPIDLSNQKKLETMSRESHLGQKIIDSKLLQFEIEAKRGMSVFHQSTFTNMFEKEAMNPQFPAQPASEIFFNESLLALQGVVGPTSTDTSGIAGQSGVDARSDHRQMMIHDMDKKSKDSYITDDPCSSALSTEERQMQKKVKDAKNQFSKNPQSFEKRMGVEKVFSAAFGDQEWSDKKLREMPASLETSNHRRKETKQLEPVISFSQRPIMMLRQQSDKNIQYFRREFNDATDRALDKEKEQLEQIYKNAKARRVEARSDQQALRKLRQQEGTHHSNHLPSLLEKKVVKDAPYVSVNDRSADMKLMAAAANAAVSNQMIDIDDLLTNEQFHSRALKTESLQKKYEDLCKKAKRITEIKKERASKSYVDIYVKHASQLPEQAARYQVKHNIDGHPKMKKIGNLKACRQQSKKTKSPQVDLENDDNKDKVRGRRRLPKPTNTANTNETDRQLSRASSFARRQEAHDQYWSYEHEYTSQADRYFIKFREVDWRDARKDDEQQRLEKQRTLERYGTLKKPDENEDEKSTIELKDLDANKHLYELIEKLDKNIDYKKNFPAMIQTDALSAFKIKVAAKKLYKLLYFPVEEEKVLKPEQLLIPRSPREIEAEEQRELAIEQDERFKEIILNTFKFYSEDPLKNEEVTCAVKKGLHAVNNFSDYDREKDLPRAPEDRLCCFHTFEHDNQIQTRYKIQLWHIHFCTYVTMHLLNLGINKEDQQLGQLDPDDHDPEQVEALYQKKKTTRQMKKELTEAGSRLKSDVQRKLDRSAEGKRELLKQMIQIAATMTEDELKFFGTVELIDQTVKNPLLKMVAVRLPGAILKVSDTELDRITAHKASRKCKLHTESIVADLRDVGMSPAQRVIAYQGEGRQLFDFAEHQELLINKMTQQVLHKFRREVKQITRARGVTFKNVNEHHDSIFSYEEVAALKQNLSRVDFSVTVRPGAGHSREHSVAGTSTNNQLREDDSALNQASIESGSKLEASFRTRPSARPDKHASRTPVQELPTLRLAGGMDVTEELNRQIGDRQTTMEDHRRQTIVPMTPMRTQYTGPLQPKDLVKSLLNMINDKKTAKIVGAYDKMLKEQQEGESEEAKKFREIRKRVMKKQSSSMSIKSKSPQGGVNESTTELARALPIEVKSQLYRHFKYTAQKKQKLLNGEESVKFAFYSKAKELLGGTYDNFDSYEVEYFKYLGSSQKIMPVPLLFKHMDDNFIYLKGLKVTMEQAMAIKEILIQAAESGSKSSEDSPFLIKTLVIDDCGMTDDVFAEIMKGIVAQSCIRSIHYTNGNQLGMKSAKLLVEVCQRLGSSAYIQELNLSNIRELHNTQPGELSFLAQITQSIESVQKASHLKFVDINLSDQEVQQNLFDIMNSMGFVLKHISISNCSIGVAGMAQISKAFYLCEKLDSLNISWNVMCQSSLKSPEPISKQAKEKAAEREVLAQEVVDNICALIAHPQSCLRHLDIAGMGFRREHFRCIFKALQKNTRLQSVNFGQIDDEPTLRLMTDMLGLESSHMVRKDGRIGLPTYMCPQGLRNRILAEHQVSFKGFYLNSELLKRNRRDALIAKSMMVEHSAMHKANKLSMLQLNRLCWNPELVFNPIAPFGRADAQYPRRWVAVPECSYTGRHCYVTTFYNQARPELNDFQMLSGQDEFMRHIEKQIRAAQAELRMDNSSPHENAPVKAPVIVANGKIYQMISATGYACLLALGELNALKKQHLAMQPYGAVEVSQIFKECPGQSSLDPPLKAQQEAYNKCLAEMDDSKMAEVLCDIAHEHLTSIDFEFMSEPQQRIAMAFEGLNWEKIIDDSLCNSDNDSNMLILNKQPFSCAGGMQLQYDAIKAAQKVTSKSRNSTRGEGDSSVAGTQVHGSAPSTSKVTERIVSYAPTMFAFACFLPPGRNEIFIYDRQNKRVLYKDLLVDMMGAEFGRKGGDWMANLERDYMPSAKPSIEIEEIERKYELDVENEKRAAQGLPPLSNDDLDVEDQAAVGN